MATLLELLHTLGEEVGEFGTFTTTGSGSTTTLVCSDFVNSNLESTSLQNATALIESGVCAGEQKAIVSGGVAKTTGILTTADAFSATIASGVAFSAYRRMPALSRLTGPSLQKAINRAHRKLWVERELSFAGTTDLKHYPVNQTTYPWFTDQKRIVEILAPVTAADDIPRVIEHVGWTWRTSGETKQLVFTTPPAATGQTFIVKANAPANSWLKKSGVWTEQTSQTAGLVALADASLSDIDDVVTVAKAYVYRDLATLKAPGQTVDEWHKMAMDWERRARRLLHFDAPKDAKAGIVDLRLTTLSGRSGR